ncbi:MAG: DNA replication and repair protein RecF [Cytophagales bacterium]|nr:DNA replication and repair protein RecF [Cytophagales bacterium]
MYLEKISLLNFKNYEELNISFHQNLNCIVGKNGSGKTNLLDAIHFLCLSKSAFNSNDSQLILHKTPFFMLKGNFKKDNRDYEVHSSLKNKGSKTFQCNHESYDKISQHIGKFPLVLIAPHDTDLIREGSEERRRFFNNLISQIDIQYLEAVIRYNFLQKSRNSLLKQCEDYRQLDYDLLETYDQQLLTLNRVIFEKRKSIIEEFTPLFLEIFQQISEQQEVVNLEYSSQLNSDDFEQEYKDALQKDIILQRTTMGVHKDDFKFLLDTYPLKKYGSQGQQKSFVIALKLSMFKMLEKHKACKPILLLDDIFDKLDENRITRLTQMVHNEEFGQVFITDASPSRVKRLAKKHDLNLHYTQIEKGEII